MKLLLLAMFACAEPEIVEAEHISHQPQKYELRDLDYANWDWEASRHNGNRPPRRLRSPTAINGADDNLCTSEEEVWMRVPCESWGFPEGYDNECYFSENEDRFVHPTCLINVCGDISYNEFYDTEVFPLMVQFRNCPPRMRDGDLDDIEVRRR